MRIFLEPRTNPITYHRSLVLVLLMQRGRSALATAFLLCVWLRQAARALSRSSISQRSDRERHRIRHHRSSSPAKSRAGAVRKWSQGRSQVSRSRRAILYCTSLAANRRTSLSWGVPHGRIWVLWVLAALCVSPTCLRRGKRTPLRCCSSQGLVSYAPVQSFQ